MQDTRRTRLALAALLIAALAMLGINYQNSSSSLITALRGAAGWAAGGAERAASSVTRPIDGLLRAGLTPGRTVTVAALQRQLVRMQAELSAARQNASAYAQLSQLLRTAGTGGYRVVPASVIAFGQGDQQTVTLDAGYAAGVRTQQTVLDSGGLAGQVIAVTQDTSTVLLATDPRSIVGTRLAPSGQIGWVSGSGQAGSRAGLLSLQVLSGTVRLRPGEQLVTAASENDRPFVPGIPVGMIISVLHRAGWLTARALVRPYAAFTSLNVVGIVVAPPRRDPRYSVLSGEPGGPGGSGQGGSGPGGSGPGGSGQRTRTVQARGRARAPSAPSAPSGA